MDSKKLILLGLTIGSTVGSYVPMLFGQDAFSLWSIFWGAVGSAAGCWVGFRLARDIF